MDGRGRAFDNIFVERLWRTAKHEDVCLKGYANPEELTLEQTECFAFYNDERPHQALANETPAGEPAGPGQRCSAASEAQAIA
jgi:putative transposase